MFKNTSTTFLEIGFKKKPQKSQLKPSAIKGFGYPGEGWEDAGMPGGNPWHMLAAGLSMGFPKFSLIQSKKSGSKTAAHSLGKAGEPLPVLPLLSPCHPVLFGVGTGAG